MSAKPAADRVALTNARYLTAEAGADQEMVLNSEYGGLLQESHLMSTGAALSLLNDWIVFDRDKAISLGANPKNIRSLRGAVSEYQSQVSGELDQMAGTQMEKLSLAFESLITANKMGEDGALRAVDCLIGFLRNDTKSSRTARGWVGGENGKFLRQALATRFLPSGWTVSVVDDRISSESKEFVGEALLASFRCGREYLAAASPFSLEAKSRDERRLNDIWKVFEVHHGESRAFFAENRQTHDWALLAYIPEGHIKALHGGFTRAYKNDIVVPALRRLALRQ